MRRIMALIICLICTAVSVDCRTAFADGGDVYAVVNNPDAADRLNLRTAPSQTAESLGKYYNGTTVQVVEELDNGWVRVQIGNVGCVSGYMMKQYLAYGAVPAVQKATPTYTSLSSAWEVYHSQSVDGSYAMYGYGETVTLLGFTPAWWHIQIREKTGFVHAGAACLEQLTGSYYDGYATAVVNNPDPTDRLNLRTEKSVRSASLGKYYNGCVAAILEKGNDGWSKVRIGNVDGYMRNEFLDFERGTKDVTAALPETIVKNLSGEGANLRKRATTGSEALALYPNGTKAQVLGLTESWCHVQINGMTGFIMTKYLDPQPMP